MQNLKQCIFHTKYFYIRKTKLGKLNHARHQLVRNSDFKILKGVNVPTGDVNFFAKFLFHFNANFPTMFHVGAAIFAWLRRVRKTIIMGPLLEVHMQR